MKKVDLGGATAVVTGASSGIGVSFARQLAAMGADLLITARRTDRLEKLAGELSEENGARVKLLPLDLETPGAAKELHSVAMSLEKPVRVLVNNAGFSSYGPFLETPPERLTGQVLVNVLALTELCRLFGASMANSLPSYILNVASLASYLPVPYFAVYAATKAYVRSFSTALAWELKGTGVTICSLCPGAVQTEFWEVSGQPVPPEVLSMKPDSPDNVARAGLEALFSGRTNVVPGAMNAAGAFMTRFGWTGITSRIAERMTGWGK